MIAAILAALGVVWWFQPDRQLRAKLENLFTALEEADRSDLEDLLDPAYSDAWHGSRAEAIENAIEASKQFYSLKITPQELRFLSDGDLAAQISFRPRLEGDGTAVAPMIREKVDRLKEPFTLTWHRQPWKPWSWTVHRVENPALKSIGP